MTTKEKRRIKARLQQLADFIQFQTGTRGAETVAALAKLPGRELAGICAALLWDTGHAVIGTEGPHAMYSVNP
jgi:hypothetical protein